MRLQRVLRQRLRSIFRTSRVENDLQQELEIHLEQLTNEYQAKGMGEREAVTRLVARSGSCPSRPNSAAMRAVFVSLKISAKILLMPGGRFGKKPRVFFASPPRSACSP